MSVESEVSLWLLKKLVNSKCFHFGFIQDRSNKKEKRLYTRWDSLLSWICFLNIHRDVAKRAHCNSLILPEKEQLQSQKIIIMQAGHNFCTWCSSTFLHSVESESFMKLSVDTIEVQTKIKQIVFVPRRKPHTAFCV